jgi:pyruvate carboxylase subunit B
MPPEATKVEPSSPSSPCPAARSPPTRRCCATTTSWTSIREMIAAMGEAVRKGGFGTSVTPVSQFYFQQAFNNVMFGPWKKIADGYGKMVLGYFGKTPVPPDPEVVKAASEQLKLEPTTTPRSAPRSSLSSPVWSSESNVAPGPPSNTARSSWFSNR